MVAVPLQDKRLITKARFYEWLDNPGNVLYNERSIDRTFPVRQTMVFNKVYWQKYCRSRMHWTFQSYKSLADTLKVSKSTIHRYLNNPSADIPIDAVLHLSRILGVSIGDYLIKEELQLKLL